MHIPENYLSPTTCALMGAVMLPIWYTAVKKVEIKVKEDKETVPMLGIATSLSFLIMMFNLPAPGGTTAHAVGASLIALLLGPWAATLSVSIALAMQAFLFGDGGILALGANCFVMAVVMPFSGYGIFKLVRGKDNKREGLASFFAGYVSINLSAFLVALLLGLQPLLFKDSSGNPLYNPYPLSVTVSVMGITHLLIGFVEGFFTVGVYQFVKRQNQKTAVDQEKNQWGRYKSLLVLIACMIVFAPLGLLASGTAFAEWDIAGLVDNLSKYHVVATAPQGMVNGFNFTSLMADYSIKGLPEPVAYILSALTAILIFFILYRLLFGRRVAK
ncbi:cobalt transporter CbiM [Streptococcus saliviloxodontae]|uniref:Cobalt/nickel transport system permease protein n=1 Tax=Streptococcus saliviloxodontae TaxID=1349416 RepID=A0ABS2PIS7_9STRE|nr:cobalt transporter CbiM [Streptococcus saliviloxodontae]MBM7635330.1 cobalt/nickel transport system permease protein [Streptococcus saliviloxodontae]